MKYSESNKPLICMQTNSKCYKNTNNKNMSVVGVLWHSTAANNPELRRYVQPVDWSGNFEHSRNTYPNSEWLAILGMNENAKKSKNPNKGNDWNHTNRQAGMNAWIGKLKSGKVTTVQTMPWNYKPWGCGGNCNDGWIQFEICEDNLKNESYFNAVYNEACQLTAYLCAMYNLDPYGTVKRKNKNGVSKNVPVILCHQDAYKLGMGSNHGDVYHWFKKYGKTMTDVRDDVARYMTGISNIKVDNSSGTTLIKPDDAEDDKFQPISDFYSINSTNPLAWIRESPVVEYNNKFYIRDDDGGYSTCRKGSPTRSKANVLCNCVGFANGAFNETYVKTRKNEYISFTEKQYFDFNCDARNFIERAKNKNNSCHTLNIDLHIKEPWQTPPEGGLIVWGGEANHVAYISKVIDNDNIEIIQAGWETPAWSVDTGNGYLCYQRPINRHAGGSNVWGYQDTIKEGTICLGFIVNPAVGDTSTASPSIIEVTQVSPTKIKVTGKVGYKLNPSLFVSCYYKWDDHVNIHEDNGFDGRIDVDNTIEEADTQ